MLKRELNFSGDTPLLYFVATPIGNLSEFSPRAIELLKNMDYVACEDTRNTGLLLQHFSLHIPLISCHEHNEETAADQILSLLKDGKKVAYASDAGYPVISDPGARLAKRALDAGYKISVINGPSACLCALVGSGLPANHFYFYGFLDSKPSARKKELSALASFPDTMIFYEAPHRIHNTLSDMAIAFGEDRAATLCRELTKTHEEYLRATLGELAKIDADTLLGEMVIVVAGCPKKETEITDEEIIDSLQDALIQSPSKEAIKKVSQTLNIPKNRVYALYLKSIKKEESK